MSKVTLGRKVNVARTGQLVRKENLEKKDQLDLRERPKVQREIKEIEGSVAYWESED